VDSADLEDCGIDGLMVNALHLSTHPGVTVLKQMGGVHGFLRWKHPVVSDSGGFQLYSLTRGTSALGKINPKGFAYRWEKDGSWKKLSADNCVHRQLRMGADIVFCLDHCTHSDSPETEQRESVQNTLRWAAIGKRAFERAVEGLPEKPLLFAVVQGGNDRGLRRDCAEGLMEIGFDGYGFGGWPTDSEGRLVDAVHHTAELIPEKYVLHGLGIGKPENLVEAFIAGYRIFDCVLPTRDARHRRLYAFDPDAQAEVFRNGSASMEDLRHLQSRDFYHHVYIGDKRFLRDEDPIDGSCDCRCCRRYSRSYLHHLFRVGDTLAFRLASIHNLRFYARLIGWLRAIHRKRGTSAGSGLDLTP
jgi:queuine tRNA-ribosyltransferase